MILVDSTGWIEMFVTGPRAPEFSRKLGEADGVLVPTVVLYEIYKYVRREASEDEAEQIAMSLQTYQVTLLTEQLALEAADFSLQHGLPMADAIIYATARAHDATLVTSDVHFAELPGVEYLPAAP